MLLLAFFTTAAAQAPTNVLARLNRLKPYRTPSHRFVVIGPQTLANMEAGRWAETVCTRVAKLLGRPLPFERREIRIVIRPTTQSPTGAVARANCFPRALTQGIEAGELVQRLVVDRLECLAGAPVQAAFCRLLLEGFLPASRRRTDPVAVPRWLSVGLARNLWREQRGEDAFRMMSLWREGRIPPLATWLERDAALWDAERDGPTSALLLAWLLEPPEGPDRFLRLMRSLNEGSPVGIDWLTSELAGSAASPADLEIAWDGWIMRQQRKVFRPGTTPVNIVAELDGELLLYPGAFDIPLASDIKRGTGFAALIEHRGDDWIVTFCRAKLASLRALAVGRGDDMVAVVERYGAFLDGLADGCRVGRLKVLLSQADAALQKLKERVTRPAARTRDETVR